MFEINIDESIVSVDWLHSNLEASNLIIFDATIPKVTQDESLSLGQVQIPKTTFFDLKNKFSAPNSQFPNTCPSEKQFTSEARQLGVNNSSAIVIYDAKGIYSSARVWWLFKTFGHNNVAVLNGGLPEWERKGYLVEKRQMQHDIEYGNFVANYKKGYLTFFEDIKTMEKDSKFTILDARSEDRFYSRIEEPRKGLRSGNITGSLNLPFDNLLNQGKLLSKNDLKDVFEKVTLNNSNLVFSCGSGITACVLALGAEMLGYINSTVYDGSWTEYGSLINNEKQCIGKRKN